MGCLPIAALLAILLLGAKFSDAQYNNICPANYPGYNCCPAKLGDDGIQVQVCGPDEPCCGTGCCQRGWTCGTDTQCHPPNTQQSTAMQPSYPVTTITMTGTTATTVSPTMNPSSIIVTTNSAGQPTTISLTTSTTTFPPAQSTSTAVTTTTSLITLTNPDGQPTTILLPPPVTTTNSAGQPTTIAFTFPTPVTTTNPDGQQTTIIPPPVTFPPITTTGSNGQPTTIIPPPFTFPTPPASTATTTMATFTFPTAITTTNSAGQPTTIPPIFTFPPTTTTNPDGQTTIIIPPPFTFPSPITTTNSDGQPTTIIFTFPTPVTTTNSAGQSTVIIPSFITFPTVTTTNSDGQTTVIVPPPFTIPTLPTSSSLPTLPSTSTSLPTLPTSLPPLPTGTSSSSSSSSTTQPGGFIIPIFTPVSRPQPADDGAVIPCNLWFFNICIRWNKIDIGGWEIVIPPGVYPPGPPPPFTSNPGDDFEIHITGTLPDWPEYTVKTNGVPTFSSQPTNCETESAEMCITSTSFGVSVSSTSTVTTTVQTIQTCATVFGCKVSASSSSTTTASTETPTNTPSAYAVYPMDGRDAGQVSSIEAQLTQLLQDTTKFKAAKYDNFGVLFWRMSITTAQAGDIRKFTNVVTVEPECGSDEFPCYDPTTDLNYQENAEDQLTYLSWPNKNPRVPFDGLQKEYFFDSNLGADVPVWLIDTGVTKNHPEFDLIRSKMVTVNTFPDFDGVVRDDDAFTDVESYNEGFVPEDGIIYKAHGTAMLSLIAGKTLGVAKAIKPYNARFPRLIREGFFTPQTYLEVCADATNKMTPSTDGKTAGIVLMAQTYPRDEFMRDIGEMTIDNSMGFDATLGRIIRLMIMKGFLVILPAGNAKKSTIDGFPQNYAKTTDGSYDPTLLVVGAIKPGEPTGERFVYGSVDPGAGLPHVYAPGDEVQVADGNAWLWPNFGYNRGGKGTSDAGAMTAGMAATLLKQIQLGLLKNDDGSLVQDSPQALRDYIVAKSWSRGTFKHFPRELAERNGIWNGIDPTTEGACLWDPNAQQPFQRRQEAQECPV